MLRGLSAAFLVALPLTAPAPAQAAEILSLTEAVAVLPIAAESGEGYGRDALRRWNTGANPSDGCNTRAEVLIAEAVEPPTVGPKCRPTGGRWFSYYDQVWVTSASGRDIDHMGPLAEAWDSGASTSSR